MSNRKRKISESQGRMVKKRKKYFAGSAWKNELRLFILDIYDLKIELDILNLIFDLSFGYWEMCVGCKEMADPAHSKCNHRIEGKVFVCRECEEDMRKRRDLAILRYPFSDDMF